MEQCYPNSKTTAGTSFLFIGLRCDAPGAFIEGFLQVACLEICLQYRAGPRPSKVFTYWGNSVTLKRVAHGHSLPQTREFHIF